MTMVSFQTKFDMGSLSVKYVPKVAAGAGFNDSNQMRLLVVQVLHMVLVVA